jgi:predicted RNA-binding Zn-ribbon protein involved in translation (DUF1610 family)
VTRIRANCPTCGEVDLTPEDVTLHLVRDPVGEVDDASTYRFACPDCTELVTKPADGRIAQLLTSGGVAVEETATGAEPDLRPEHPERPPSGPALTLDDLLDLHLLLDQPTWFDRVLALSWPVPTS